MNSKKILVLSVLALIGLRLILVFFVTPNLPHLEQYEYNNYFSLIQEGDEEGYFILAEMIYNFDFKEDYTMLGYPLFIVPFLFVFGDNFSDVFLPLVLFNAFILFSLSIALVVWLSFLIFKKILPAVLSGFLFVVFPFIFYIFRSYGPQFKTGAWNDTNFFHMNWLSAMADQPAAFLALLVLFLVILNKKKEWSLAFCGLLGFLVGVSALVRITNIVIVVAVGMIMFLYEKVKKYKKLSFFALFACLGFLPQFIYNFIFFASPISFGYQKEYSTEWVAAGSAQGPMWELDNFFHLFLRAVDYSWLVIPAFILLFVFIMLGFLHIKKTNQRNALAVLSFFLLPTLIYMFFETGQTAMRYYLPAVAPFIILSVASLSCLFDYAIKRK